MAVAVAVGGDVGAFLLGMDRMERFAVVSILVVFCATGVVFVVSRADAVGGSDSPTTVSTCMLDNSFSSSLLPSIPNRFISSSSSSSPFAFAFMSMVEAFNALRLLSLSVDSLTCSLFNRSSRSWPSSCSFFFRCEISPSCRRFSDFCLSSLDSCIFPSLVSGFWVGYA